MPAVGLETAAGLLGVAAGDRDADHDDAADDDSTGARPRGRATSVIRRTTRAAPSADEAADPPAALPPVEPAPPVGAPPEATAEPEPPVSGMVPASEPASTPEGPSTMRTGEAPAPASEAREAPVATPPPPPSLGELRMLADPTQRPPGAVTGVTDAPPAPSAPAKPLLASEALMEDLAPVEPAARDARVWCGVCGFGFLLFGLLSFAGLIPGALASALPWLITGAIALVAAISRVGYRQRAVAMLVLGLLTGLVALQGSGTLVRADGGAGWGMARLFSVVTLTAALLFRARYRAYAGARVFLGTALAISVPFAIHAALVFTTDAGFGPAHVGAALVLIAMAATLIGFMGAETTGAGPYVALALVFAVTIELASRGVAVVGLDAGLPPLLGVLVGAAGFGAAAGFTALGLFQILASRFAADARRIDIHSTLEDQPPRSEHDPSSEWTSRGQ